MRTIFITSFNPFATRNILLTNVFQILRNRADLRLVIFCPDYKIDYFQDSFRGNNVIIEPIKAEQTARRDVFFGFLGRSVINTTSLRMHRREILVRNKKIFGFLFANFLATIGWLPIVKRVIRGLDFLTAPKNKFADYFEKYRPDLVFATDVFHVDDTYFLAESKKRKTFTVGMVRSWDNITGKGLFRVKPDKLIVNNETIKKEAIKYEDISPKDIFVGGLPQFDYYVNYEPNLSRADFFKKIRLDPNKKTILFIPVGRRFYDGEGKVLAIIQEAINDQVLVNVQVLVRFPPNDDVNLEGFKLDDNFSIDRPGKQFRSGVFRDQEMTAEDMTHLADSLYYSDVLVGYSSSMVIDGSVFEKPFVLVEGFDPDGPRPYEKSCVRFLDYHHVYTYLVENGSTRLARSKEQMISDIKDYLNNPRLDSEGRQRLIKSQAEPLDGKSGLRIAEFLISQLKK